ncbi:MAG: hypothetical protein SGI92_24590 [Bryobacteraceae bacterium]|nr:hypothetical protein [Bryobacteraceae bacterium]
MDHINVKIFATEGSVVNWPELIPVFHRWIRDNEVPGTPIDVADYAHVPNGPGILLIAHEAMFSVDNRAGRLGFLYNRRTPAEGDVTAKVRDAYDTAVSVAKKLEAEIRGVKFEPSRFEIFVNDRALAPNNEETDRVVRPAVEALCAGRVAGVVQIVAESADPRTLYRLQVKPAA